MSVARGTSTGSGDTSLVSQAPANRFIRWLLRYLQNSNNHMNKKKENYCICPLLSESMLNSLSVCSRHAGNAPSDYFSHQPFWRVFHTKLFGHKVKGIEGVNGELNENRTRSSRLSNGERSPHGGYDLSDSPDGRTELTQGLEERHLVNVLQGSPALSHIEDGDIRQRNSGKMLFAAVLKQPYFSDYKSLPNISCTSQNKCHEGGKNILKSHGTISHFFFFSFLLFFLYYKIQDQEQTFPSGNVSYNNNNRI